MSGTLDSRTPSAGYRPHSGAGSGYALVAGACIVNRSGALVAVHRGHLPAHALAPAALAALALATRDMAAALHRWTVFPLAGRLDVTTAQAAAGALICVMLAAPGRARAFISAITSLAAAPVTEPLPSRYWEWTRAAAHRLAP